MLKGISLEKFENIDAPHFITSENVIEKLFLFQDTSKTSKQKIIDPQLNLAQPALALPSVSGQTTHKNLDSIFARSYQREKAISSHRKIVIPQLEIAINPEDTISFKTYQEVLPYQHSRTDTDVIFQENFLLSIPYKTFSHHFDTASINNISTIPRIEKSIHIAISPRIKKDITGIEGTALSESSVNWIAGLLLLSLFVFSWMKILYQKYILQVVAAAVNYQSSVRLLREKNVLFKNMSVGLNLVFAINIGLFLFFVMAYFNISQIVSKNNFLSILIYCISIATIYSIKTLLCRFIGYLFLAQAEFSEYVHNINLFNKNIGLFLFPIVIMIPYINDSLKPIILYFGIVLFLGLFILRIIRGFQIIIHKGVSSFYLILYLCAVEILPVLLIVKYSSTLI